MDVFAYVRVHGIASVKSKYELLDLKLYYYSRTVILDRKLPPSDHGIPLRSGRVS
jgi:hypothetical protein